MAIGYSINLAADGSSPERAAASARAIKSKYKGSPSGLYWIVNPNVNSGSPFQVYCDMLTDGGGWMLIMQNTSLAGTELGSSNYSLFNQLSPPTARSRADVTTSYSILGWADALKNPSKPFEYMIEGYERNSYGGIWRANDPSYSFVDTSSGKTNITLLQTFNSWSYNTDGIEARMPWRSGSGSGFLTTSASATSAWWGTLIEGNVPGGYGPAPYMASGVSGTSITQSPGVIWYWMRSV
jgi:hypothetical protein